MKKDFYGQEIIPLKLKNGEEAKSGDVIRWKCWDGDDNTSWIFTGIYKSNHIIYLGGGIDFGMGIGKKIEIQEAIEESEDNEELDVGFTKIGEAKDIHLLIGNFNKE